MLASGGSFRYTGAPMARSVLARFVPLVAFASLAAASCVGDSSAQPGPPQLTLLSVDPKSFLGPVPCGVPGGAQRYVVKLTDLGPNFYPPPSSTPTRCTDLTTFTPNLTMFPTIEPGEYYIAQIDVYDRDDVVAGTPDDGGVPIVDPVTRETVPPRWTTSCGMLLPADAALPDGPVPLSYYATLSINGTEVFMHACLPLSPAAADGGAGDAADERTASPDAGDEGGETPDGG